jgi:hypothetical protein
MQRRHPFGISVRFRNPARKLFHGFRKTKRRSGLSY